MASTTAAQDEFVPAHQPNSALALLPPASILEHVQPLRSVYDQAARKWPPHMNIFYPFVDQTAMTDANQYLSTFMHRFESLNITFDRAEAWKTGPHYTIVLRPSEASEAQLEPIYDMLMQKFPAFAKSKRHRNGGFKPHMTIGQTKDNDLVKVLTVKTEKLCTVIGEMQWHIGTLSRISGVMSIQKSFGGSFDARVELSKDVVDGSNIPQETFEYLLEHEHWQPLPSTTITTRQNGGFSISTYNCMFEPSIDPTDELSRYRRLIKNILSTHSTIVCLQEVSDSFLSYILAYPKMRERYKYISHNGVKPLLHWRNCVTLSMDPFKWSKLVIDKTRTAVVAEFAWSSSSDTEKEVMDNTLVVVNVHLPSSTTNEAVSAKLAYYQTVHHYLIQNKAKNTCIIAGDFNLPSNETIHAALSSGLIDDNAAQEINKLFPAEEYIDSWDIVSDVSTNSGATFDPFINNLAKKSVDEQSKLLPCQQRFDRILLKRQDEDEVVVRDATLFGLSYNSESASDHWGFSASFMHMAYIETKPDLLSLPEIESKDVEIRSCLAKWNPSQEDKAVRSQAVDALQQCLKGQDQLSSEDEERSAGFKMELTPVGSYGLGTWDDESDIDCLVVGNITVKTFWKVAKQRIRKWTGIPIRIVRFVNAAIPMLILLVNDKVRIDLQYCTAVRLVETWSSVLNLPHDDPLFNLPVATLKKLQAFRDMNHLLLTLPNLPKFRLAYRFIKNWAVNRGIYSSKFGYLGGVHITLLLSRVCLLLPGRADLTQILKTFFAQYAQWNWASESVWQPNLPRKIRYQRSAREKMVILTVHAPAVNVAFNATNHTVQTLSDELQKVDSMMDKGEDWLDYCQDGSMVQQEFLSGYTRYIKVEVQFWGNQKAKGRALIGWVESRCVMLLADLATKVPSVHARIWPKRFHEVANVMSTTQDTETDTEESPVEQELRGFYLIGLSSKIDGLQKDERRAIESTFADTLRSFEDAMKRTEAGKFDEADSWLQVRSVKSAELAQAGHHVAEDTSDIWDGGVGDDNKDDESSDEEDEDEDQELISSFENTVISKGNKQKSVQNEPTPKLRPSHEVLSRIRWDPTLDASDYVVGYEDRFRGVIEMNVLDWKMEMSDEEFVPMHRIIWFRRRSDNEKVWDRAQKLDRLFGSGVKQ